jgi:hypothetical protein
VLTRRALLLDFNDVNKTSEVSYLIPNAFDWRPKKVLYMLEISPPLPPVTLSLSLRAFAAESFESAALGRSPVLE